MWIFRLTNEDKQLKCVYCSKTTDSPPLADSIIHDTNKKGEVTDEKYF